MSDPTNHSADRFMLWFRWVWLARLELDSFINDLISGKLIVGDATPGHTDVCGDATTSLISYMQHPINKKVTFPAIVCT